MMFMKQFCVSVALETGHDVLFQDLDITWLHDPRKDEPLTPRQRCGHALFE